MPTGKASKPRNPKLQIPGKAQASVKRKATKPSVIDDATDSEDEPLSELPAALVSFGGGICMG